MVRCFIGIMIPEGLKDGIESLQKKIVGTGAQCKLVERENLHLSLSFLGDVEDLEGISEKTKMAVTGMKRFSVDVKGIMFIPNEKFIRVIALDTHDNTGELERLRLNVRKIVGGDSYKAHATLCRVKNIPDKKQFLELIAPLMGYDAGSFDVNSIQLIKSELSSEGPVYTVVEDFPLE